MQGNNINDYEYMKLSNYDKVLYMIYKKKYAKIIIFCFFIIDF